MRPDHGTKSLYTHVRPGAGSADLKGCADVNGHRFFSGRISFNPYRKRLIQKGIADGSRHGHLTFTLPLFDLFVVENSDFPGEINL